VRLDALEPFEEYITEVHQYLYDTIYCYTVQKFIEENSDSYYDVILMVDVLEHFPKEEGMEIVTKLKVMSSDILVSIPIVVSPQGAAFGNKLETHHATWTQEELKDIGAYKFFPSNNSWICLIH
jgi:2-polyprenyl-3-methyl-5-hydroxy-6-metoxy-1,4-benzoquinol methylase